MNNDFIITVENSVPDEYCDEAIKYFENAEKAGLVADRKVIEPEQPRYEVSDYNTGFSAEKTINTTPCQVLLKDYLYYFWGNVYKPYAERYDIVNKAATHKVYSVKMQRTEPGQAFHKWHFEQMSRENCIRIMTFITYLNDVEEGGETEFLYYPRRVEARKGRTILFPGSFTHVHRGNQPLSGTKYILTGWLEY